MSGEISHRRSLAAGATTALIGLVAAGCGAGAVIDDRAAEIDVREGFKELDVRVRGVACPSDVEVERGADYACRAETAKGVFRVLYRQLDEDGSVGRPRLERIPGGR